jgi:hypothetical protein
MDPPLGMCNDGISISHGPVSVKIGVSERPGFRTTEMLDDTLHISDGLGQREHHSKFSNGPQCHWEGPDMGQPTCTSLLFRQTHPEVRWERQAKDVVLCQGNPWQHIRQLAVSLPKVRLG